MSPIAKRLRASVRMDAHNGDLNERAVCGRQMLEAAAEIERLEEIVADAAIRMGERLKIIDDLHAALKRERGNSCSF